MALLAGIFERAPELPLLLQRRGTDEFRPAPDSPEQRQARAAVVGVAPDAARRAALPLARYLSGRLGTAASLLALNASWQASGDGAFYDVVPEAAHDPEAAEESLGGTELVVDVQTHYVAQERATAPAARAILAFIRQVAPERWESLPGAAALSMAEFLRCVYLESETAVAVLTSAPGEGDHNILTNAEIAGTRELLDRLGNDGRLLHHAIVHPNLAGELEAMEALRDRYQPVGWKVYTLYPGGGGGRAGWRLDDEGAGIPFLERSRELGVRVVCAHKGLSQLAPTGSPDDVGPAAAAFPDLDFLIYHSGYEVPVGDREEGPYQASATPAGTDRLVASLLRAGVAPGANVYAELGSTWYLLARRPREAAHVLGKLLRAVGEDNVLWGTDSVWYGSPQPLIDAFRAFQIPASYCDRYGYPALTPRVKEKILGLNAARVYDIDPARARRVARSDDLAWVRAALDEARTGGTPRQVAE
jgi:predicted TIM-barrel fold metal-dependent hydrolase